MMKHLMIAGILSCFSMGGFAQIYKELAKKRQNLDK